VTAPGWAGNRSRAPRARWAILAHVAKIVDVSADRGRGTVFVTDGARLAI
jgi:hypothetical protein